MATDAEITHLNLALSVDENIGGLHIWRGKLLERDKKKSTSAKVETWLGILCYFIVFDMSAAIAKKYTHSSAYLCVLLTGYCADALMPWQSAK